MTDKQRFSSRTDWELTTNEITELKEQLVRKGHEVIDLTVSNPTRCGLVSQGKDIFPEFDHDANRFYDPDPKGSLSVRQAISEYYAQKGYSVDPERILITSSTSEGYSFLFRLLADVGDNVLFPRPSYPLFQFLTDINDVEFRTYALSFDRYWRTDLADLAGKIDTKTKAVVFVNPNNPTGNLLTNHEVARVDLLCQETQTSIICDEVFSDFLLENEGPFQSLVNNQEALTFVLNGISKILGLPQMKLSWIVVSGPEILAQQAMARLEVIADTFLSVNTPVQNAFIEWMRDKDAFQQPILDRIRTNWNVLKRIVAEQRNVQVLASEGGWYAVLQCQQGYLEEEFILRLLKNQGVFVHPGYFFDFDQEGILVLSLLPETKLFQKGIQKLFTCLC